MTFGQKIFSSIGFIPRSEVARLVRQQKDITLRSFEAVSMGRLTKDFMEMNATIDADIRAGGSRLRNRSRQMYENSPHARRLVDLYVSNVIGENGTNFQSDIKIYEEDADTKQVILVSDEEKNAVIEDAFAEWCMPKHCSVTQNQSYATIKKIAGRNKARDGEAFIRRVVDPSSKFGLRLQIIPPEMVAENYTTDLPSGNSVIMGVEMDSWRKPVAYYLRKNSPTMNLWGMSGLDGEMERIPAADIIHWFDPDFSNQTRGYSKMANILLMLNWLKEYNRANMLNAKFTARKLGFFSDLNPEDPAGNIGSDTSDTRTSSTVNGAETTQTRPAISGEELSFTYIGNTKLEKWDPVYPHEQHEMFNRVTLREIATGWGCAACSVSGDYSNSTWSSSRTELEVERHNWLHEQTLMIDTVDTRIFSWWLELALIKGAIRGFRYSQETFDRLNKPYFFGPRWDYINPVDESNALRSDAEAQFISPFDVAAKKGKRYEDILREIKAAERLRKKYGVGNPVYGSTPIQSTGLEPATAAPAAAPSKNGNGKSNGVHA